MDLSTTMKTKYILILKNDIGNSSPSAGVFSFAKIIKLLTCGSTENTGVPGELFALVYHLLSLCVILFALKGTLLVKWGIFPFYQLSF